MRNPLTPKHHLESYYYDPNYHRLNYQLAAQMAHQVLAGRTEDDGSDAKPSLVPIPDEIRRYYSIQRSEPGDQALLERMKLPAAAESALRARKEALGVCREFEEQDNHRKWKPWPRRGKRDLRLHRFLRNTVVPCLDLVIAGAERYEKATAEASQRADKIRRSVDAGTSTLSYRTVYNLACYESEGGEAGRQSGLKYLREALRMAPSDRSDELARWAWLDPSLASLRKVPEFADIVGPIPLSLADQDHPDADPHLPEEK